MLSRRDIERTISHHGLDTIMALLVNRLRTAMTDLDPRRTVTPIRSGFNYQAPHPGLVEWMPVHEVGRDVSIKIVGYHPDNPTAFGLPTILSTLSAYDTDTGHLRCIMDGVLPTALRTAAASVVASQLLARPDAAALGIIGCGAQAVAHVHALGQYFNLRRILVHDTDPAAAASLSERCYAFGGTAPITVAPLEELVATADLLLTATSIEVGAGPLFDGISTKAHLHVNAIGSDFPGKTELPLSLLRSSYVCPDFRSQASVEGECQRLSQQEIGEDVVALCKRSTPTVELQQRRTVYDSTGWSLQDQVSLRLFTELADELRLGRRIEIENTSGSTNNPYDFLLPVATAAL